MRGKRKKYFSENIPANRFVTVMAVPAGAPPPALFAHLLQPPPRDLAANWAVDVARELQAYLDAVAQTAPASFDSFAEAALVIQGSALVYSKKVDLLYQLVFATLGLVAAGRPCGRAGRAEVARPGPVANLPPWQAVGSRGGGGGGRGGGRRGGDGGALSGRARGRLPAP